MKLRVVVVGAVRNVTDHINQFQFLLHSHPFIVHNGTMGGVSFHTKLMLGPFLCVAWFNQWPVVESDKSYFWAQGLEKIIWLCLPFYVFCHLPWAEQVPEWDMSGEVYLYLTCFLKPKAQTDPQMWEQEHIHLLSEAAKIWGVIFHFRLLQQ